MPPKRRKFESTFPAARIKKIMQLDDDVGRVASSVPVVISRAVEIFIHAMLTRAADYATSRSAKTLTVNHLKHVIEQEKQWDFLKDLTAKVSDVAKGEGQQGVASRKGRKRQNSQSKALGVKRKHVQEEKEEEEEARDSDSSGDEGEEEVITPSQRGPPPLLHVADLNPKCPTQPKCVPILSRATSLPSSSQLQGSSSTSSGDIVPSFAAFVTGHTGSKDEEEEDYDA